MNSEKRTEEKIDSLLKRNNNGGFTNPPADYFEHFTDRLTLKKETERKIITFSRLKDHRFQFSASAVAAIFALALWVFVFDANIKDDFDAGFTVEELISLNDFQNYNEDLIYSELTFISNDEQLSNDEEVDALLDLSAITADEIIELYSTDDIK